MADTDIDRSTGAVTTPRQPGAARRVTHPGLVLLIIAGAQLMVVLDATIVNIALPAMGDYFHKSQTSMTWALNAYTLAFGGLLLLGGRAGDMFGRRRMFMVGLALFTLGSLLAGVATNFQFMIFGRVVQGIGGAIASPTALSLVTTSFDEGPARNRAFGVYAAVSGAGAALGLLLGGVLTEYLTWRWVLFVNIPIGLLLIAGSFVYLTESERYRGRFDILGGVLSTLGMLGIVYAFIHAASAGWSNATTLGAMIGGIVLMLVFFVYQAKAKEPMLPLRVIRDRNRGGAYLVMLIVGAAMFGMFYFVTFFVQQVMGFSPLRAGFAFLPVAFTIGIVSQVVSKLLPRVGPRPLIATGATLLTAAMFFYSTVDKDSGYLNLFLWGMLVMALGMGCIFVPLTTVAVSRVRSTDAGVASAMLNVGQQVGGAIGLSVLANVAATAGRSSAADHQAGLSQALRALPQSLQGALGTFIHGIGQTAPDSSTVKQFLGSLPSGQRGQAAQFLGGPLRDFSATVQAHASAMGFLAAAFFGIAAIIVSLVLINVKRDDVPAEGAPMAHAA